MNGNLLLNLCPDGQGAINAPQVNTLKEVGNWLEVNGAAVHGSRNWTKASDVVPGSGGGRGVTYRFTVKGDDLFAIAQT
jgi:alpha-L-fucosidase